MTRMIQWDWQSDDKDDDQPSSRLRKVRSTQIHPFSVWICRLFVKICLVPGMKMKMKLMMVMSMNKHRDDDDDQDVHGTLYSMKSQFHELKSIE